MINLANKKVIKCDEKSLKLTIRNHMEITKLVTKHNLKINKHILQQCCQSDFFPKSYLDKASKTDCDLVMLQTLCKNTSSIQNFNILIFR